MLVQAGSSESGKDFAARYAEAVFTAQRTLAEGQAFYRDLEARVVKAGRDPPRSLRVLPGIVPFIGGETEEEAKALEQEFTDLISPAYSLRQLSTMLGVDLTEHALDAPLPPPLPPIERIQGNKSRYQLVKDLAENEGLTVRQLIGKLGGGRGHRTFAGTPEQIADELQLWFEQAPPTVSTSCRRTCPVGSRTSPRRSCRSFRSADCSAPTTPPRLCAATTAWTGR